MDASVQSAGLCSGCGGELRPTRVRSAFWHGEQLVVVEGIPALECAGCHERFFDDDVAIRLDLLKGAGFPSSMATSELAVPVFSFEPSRGEPP